MMTMYNDTRMKLTAKILCYTPKKHAGSKELIIELGLAAIAVALLLLYKDQIATMLKALMNTATTTITGAFSKATV